jgi:hypothetical protein
MSSKVIEKVENMKRMVLGYLLSAATVYLTMSFLTKFCLDLISTFKLSMI